jgi:uncharacterized protein (DUF2141 family)
LNGRQDDDSLQEKDMKALIFGLALQMTTTISGFSQTRLEISVEKIRNTTGTVRVGLFASDETFLKKAIDGKVIKADNVVTVIFEDLKPGDYAISVIHDENENSELDMNTFGIPKEGFAFGNNSMGLFGPPSFEKAKITIVSGKTVKQTLELKYF